MSDNPATVKASPPAPTKPFKVHLDPGHGGEDQGEEANGLVEAELNRNLAFFLGQLLTQRGYEVSVGPQTAADGSKFPNSERVALANRTGSVLLVLHENGGGGSYSMIEYMADNPQSAGLAGFVQKRFQELFKDLVSDVRLNVLQRGERGGILLEGAKHSAVLLEPLFLDNPKHAAWAKDHNNRAALGTAIADALDDLAKSAA